MTVDPDFVSRQTHDARRFYLNLQPRDEQPLSLVCGGVERMDPEYVVDRHFTESGTGLATTA